MLSICRLTVNLLGLWPDALNTPNALVNPGPVQKADVSCNLVNESSRVIGLEVGLIKDPQLSHRVR